MKLLQPIEDFDWSKNISQLYGVNPELYKNLSIPFHNGLDYVFPDDKDRGFGRPVRASHSGVVTKIFSDFPTKTHGTGIYLNSETEDGYIETVYWHLSDVTLKVGDEVKAWDIIGLVGNTGFVNPKPSKYCPYCGTHLHFAVKLYDKQGNLKQTETGFVDPTPLLYNVGEKLPIRFTKTLSLGSTGDQISWLQTCLKLAGFAEDYEPVGYFGFKTLRDVRRLQKKLGLSQVGIVGPKTRGHLNAKFAI